MSVGMDRVSQESEMELGLRRGFMELPHASA